MLPFLLPSFFFSWSYWDSPKACAFKPGTFQYLHFPQLQTLVEKEISTFKALIFSSKSSDFKNIFSQDEKKPYHLMGNVFSLSPHLFAPIPMTLDFSRIWTLGAHFQKEERDVVS